MTEVTVQGLKWRCAEGPRQETGVEMGEIYWQGRYSVCRTTGARQALRLRNGLHVKGGCLYGPGVSE